METRFSSIRKFLNNQIFWWRPNEPTIQYSNINQQYGMGMQGSQGEQAEDRRFLFSQYFGRTFAMTTHFYIWLNIGAYVQFSLTSLFAKYGPILTGFITILMLYLFGLLIYTHYKLQSTSPGYPERVATATGHLKLNFEKSQIKIMSQNLKQLIAKRNKGFVALLNSGQPNFTKYQNQCFKCVLKPLKPHRSYHCSVCERDIIYMDHHCIWANNCIGLENYRFFLAFIFYLVIALNIQIWTLLSRNNSRLKTQTPSSSSLTISEVFYKTILCTDIIIFISIIPYTFINWQIALSGKTRVEQKKGLFDINTKYKKEKKNDQHDIEDILEKHYDQLAQFIQMYKIESWSENLYVIFGTYNFIYAIIFPFERILPLRGLEWSFMNLTGPVVSSSVEMVKRAEDTDQLL